MFMTRLQNGSSFNVDFVAGGNATWTDQAPVRAALHGRVLILDGMEKVRTKPIKQRAKPRSRLRM